MLRATRHYVLVFLLTGAPFALFSRIFTSPGGALVRGAFFGVFMALTVGTVNLRSGGGSGDARRSLWPRQHSELVVSAELRVVGERVHDALVALPAKITSNSTTTLEAKTGLTWRSYGEVLRVELEPAQHGTHVRVASRPIMPLTVVDYGRGRQQVDAVVAALSRAFPVVGSDIEESVGPGPTDPSPPPS
jgi:hypothetical protein